MSGPIVQAIENPGVIANFKALADAGLSLDLGLGNSSGSSTTSANPTIVLRLTDKIPSLRLILPHVPNAPVFDDISLPRLRELRSRPHVYMKLSQVVSSARGSTDLGVYRDRLDLLWEIFGEDRIMFGGDWPSNYNKGNGPFSAVMSVAQAYLGTKGPTATAKVFWRNSASAYRWTRRDSSQPQV